MGPIRVMIAEDNLEIQRSLVKHLSAKSDIELISVEADGFSAKEAALSKKPDVLLLDLVLPVLDGFGVMTQIQKAGLSDMRIIVLSGLARDDLIHMAMDMGAFYYMAKPADPERVYEHIVRRDPFTTRTIPTMSEEDDMDKRLDQMLIDIGIPMNIKGRRYLKSAISIASKLDDLSGRITKEIYPAVARIHDSTPSQVERAIRHAISIGWAKTTMTRSGWFAGGKCPTNGEVIMVLAEKLDAKGRLMF